MNKQQFEEEISKYRGRPLENKDVLELTRYIADNLGELSDDEIFEIIMESPFSGMNLSTEQKELYIDSLMAGFKAERKRLRKGIEKILYKTPTSRGN